MTAPEDDTRSARPQRSEAAEHAGDTGSLQAAIKAQMPALTPAEARVAKVLLSAEDQLIYRSAVDVAEQAKSALSTVVRTCQRLGFKGFQDLKIAMARENKPMAASELVDEVSVDDRPSDILDKIAGAARDAIDLGLARMDRDAFARAVDRLANTGRLLCLGVGTSAPLAADAAYRFLWIGINADAPADAHVQHVSATLLQPEDTALIISHTGSTRETVAVAEAASRVGATVIAITSFSRSPLTDVADIVLVATSRETAYRVEALSSRVAHLVIVDALWTAAALAKGPEALGLTRRIADVITEHRY